MSSACLRFVGWAGALIGAAGSASAAPVSAEAVLRAHRALTSIGPDPCRDATGDEIPDDEIVVCARRTNPYEVPLYRAPVERYDGPGTAEGRVLASKRAGAPCHARGEACTEPLPVVTIGFGRGIKPPVRVGSGGIGED